MNKKLKTFLITSNFFLALFVFLNFRRFIGDSSGRIVSGDILDSINHYLIIPGSYPAIVLDMIIFGKRDEYNLIFMLALSAILAAIFYGWIVATIIIKWRKFRYNSAENKSAA